TQERCSERGQRQDASLFRSEFCESSSVGTPSLEQKSRPRADDRISGTDGWTCFITCRPASIYRESEPILPALFSTGIEALDKVLPKGIPRNSMMILAGELGTGKSVLMSQLLYGVLKRRKEPCIYMTFEGPPLAVEQDMESFGWDIAPFLESGQLRFMDCFS